MIDEPGHPVIIGAEVMRHYAFRQEVEYLLELMYTTRFNHYFNAFISYIFFHRYNYKWAVPRNVCSQMYAKNISNSKLKILVDFPQAFAN